MAHAGNTPGQGNPKPRPIYKDWTVLQLAALVLLVDQFTKFLVIELIPFRWSFPSAGFFRLTHVHNTGSAFGILQGLNTPLIFVSFVGVIILVLIYRSQAHPSNWLRLSLGLQLGGAFGNLIDRLRLGYVTDFIDVGPWPVFNLADASIVIGLLLLAWIFLRPGRGNQPGPAVNTTGTIEGTLRQEGYNWCPVCDGEMMTVPGGWRCLSCGVTERIEIQGSVDHVHQTREPSHSTLTSLRPPDGHIQQGFSANHSELVSEDAGDRDGDSDWPRQADPTPSPEAADPAQS